VRTFTNGLAVSAFCLSALLGCSSDSAEPASTTKPEKTTTTAAQTPTTQLTDIEHQPGEGKYEGALADVTNAKCERSEGGWTATGTAKNPTKAAADYRIFISLLTAKDVTRGVVEVKLDQLGAGESTDYTQDLKVDEDDLHCVLRVERRASA
jgi:hypothetical protein